MQCETRALGECNAEAGDCKGAEGGDAVFGGDAIGVDVGEEVWGKIVFGRGRRGRGQAGREAAVAGVDPFEEVAEAVVVVVLGVEVEVFTAGFVALDTYQRLVYVCF